MQLRTEFVLPDLTLKSLKQKFAEILKLNREEISAKTREGEYILKSRAAGAERLNYLVQVLRGLAREPTGPKIAIFVYLGKFGRWRALRTCVETVLQAASAKSVDVMLTVSQHHKTLKHYLPNLRSMALDGFRLDMMSYATNTGAESVFLQQLLLARELSLEPDIIFKLHAKEEERWRSMMIENLCGSLETVRAIISQFQSDPELGMIGPANFTWTKDGPSNHVALGQEAVGFKKGSVQHMKRIWTLMRWKRMLPEQMWTVVAGSLYWVRAGLGPWQDFLLPKGPEILQNCAERDCTGALQILLPTLVASAYKVAAGNVTISSPSQWNAKNATKEIGEENSFTSGKITAEQRENRALSCHFCPSKGRSKTFDDAWNFTKWT